MSRASDLLRLERWLERAPLARLYTWLTSVPGALATNTPAYNLHEELQLRPDNRVLDVACGRGSLLSLLSARVAFEKPPVGIDASRRLLTLDTSAAIGERVQGSPQALPFAGEAFDVVTCAYALNRLTDEEMLALLREIRRVLSHGGIAVLWDFAPTHSSRLNRWNRRVLETRPGDVTLRGYATLSAYALEAGFEWVQNAHLRPFLMPPIPRVSIIIGKAPVGWTTDVPAVNEAIMHAHPAPEHA